MAQMVKNPPAMRETWVRPLGWEDLLEEGMQPTPVFLLGEFHGQSSLASYSPWGLKESDTTERLSTAQGRYLHHVGFTVSIWDSCWFNWMVRLPGEEHPKTMSSGRHPFSGPPDRGGREGGVGGNVQLTFFKEPLCHKLFVPKGQQSTILYHLNIIFSSLKQSDGMFLW